MTWLWHWLWVFGIGLIWAIKSGGLYSQNMWMYPWWWRKAMQLLSSTGGYYWLQKQLCGTWLVWTRFSNWQGQQLGEKRDKAAAIQGNSLFSWLPNLSYNFSVYASCAQELILQFGQMLPKEWTNTLNARKYKPATELCFQRWKCGTICCKI